MLCWINKRFVFARDKPDTQKNISRGLRDLKGLTQAKCLNRGKTWLTKSHVVLVLYTIGLKRGTPFRMIELSKALKIALDARVNTKTM